MQNYCACHNCVARPFKILMYCRAHSGFFRGSRLVLAALITYFINLLILVWLIRVIG